MQRGRSTRAMAVAVGVVAMLGLAACGSSSSKGAAAEKTSESVKSSESSDSTGAKSSGSSKSGGSSGTTAKPAPIEYTLGKTGWYDGFAVTLDKMTAQAGDFHTELVIDATLENLGDEPSRLVEGDIVVDGESLLAQWDTPNIPGKGKAKGTITVELENTVGKTDAPLDKAAIDKKLATANVVFGNAADNQTKIPLSAAGKVESLQPKDLTVTGKLTQGQLIIEVLSGHLQPSYESGEKGKAELDLRFKISCAADCQSSGYNTDASQFSVKGPDGTSVVADSRSAYCCDAIYPGTVSDNAKNNHLVFVVPTPGTGAYTLTYNNSSLTSNGTPPATLAFTA